VSHWFGRGQPTKDFENAALRTLRGRALLADIEHPGGGHARAEAILHAMSAHCASLIYPGMVHKDSSIIVALPLYEGGVREAKGHAVDCRHLSGSMHAVMLVFDQPVELAEMFAPGVALPIRIEPAPKPTVKQFQASCVVLGSDPLDAKLITFLSGQLGITTEIAGDIGSMFDKVTGNEFDLVIADCDAIARAGGTESIVARLGRIGLRAGLIVLNPTGTKVSESDSSGGLQLRTLARPITKESLIEVVEDILKGVEPGVAGAIVSTLNDAGAAELVEEYVSKLAHDLEVVLRARENNDLGVVREAAVRWRENAASFGFAPLSTAAKSAVLAMDASMSLEESGPELRRAISVARRIVASMRPTTEDRAA
jgi:hypothetical protein